MMKEKNSKEVVHEFSFAGGTCSLSTGKIAQRSNSAVIGRMGDTVVLVTVNVGDPIEGMDFFPLQVEYIERMYAGGLISSSRFVKRERFPSLGATLSARMLDRAVRSRFPSDYRNQVQIVLTVLSYDPEHDPVIVGFTAISAALMISDAPFEGPITGVRVGYEDEEMQLCLKDTDKNGNGEKTLLNFVLSTDGEMITMIDSDSLEVSEDVIAEAMEFGVESSKEVLDEQKKFLKKVEAEFGAVVKPEYDSFAVPKDLLSDVRKEKKKALEKALEDETRGGRREKLEEIKQELFSDFEGKYSKNQMSEACDYVVKEIVREWILKDNRRMDGRELDEVRPLSIEASVLPRAHGSALFARGGTQTLTVTTLGSGRLEQIIEGMEGEGSKRYMHHYNAPDYSVGSAGRYRFIPKRREFGHGSLAEKALLPVLPDQEVFPYTIVVVSEIMSQSGSSSMAAVCGSTLSLMNAGVPITSPVAGIAMGVVVSDDMKKIVLLTDIFEYEDYFGDMDFKVAGTEKGITAIQMDNKKSGLPVEIFKEALVGAKKARLDILKEMKKVVDGPSTSLSKYAPKIDIVMIPPDRVGELIGPGGKVIKGIIEKTGADIDIQDDGKVSISSHDEASREEAVDIVENMFEEAEIGKVYTGKVAKIAEYGAFVDVSASISGLVHISEMKEGFVKDPRTVVKEGQMVKVKVVSIDDRGRLKMSMKQVSEKESSEDSPEDKTKDDAEDKPDDKK